MIDTIIIHCADTPNGRPHDAAEIHRWHLERGWDGIGYHYIIQIGGMVEAGRPHYWTGAHVAGHNSGSLGICLIGRDFYTLQQYRALERLLDDLRLLYPAARIRGHRDFDPGKTCPGFDVQQWLEDIGLDPQ